MGTQSLVLPLFSLQLHDVLLLAAMPLLLDLAQSCSSHQQAHVSWADHTEGATCRLCSSTLYHRKGAQQSSHPRRREPSSTLASVQKKSKTVQAWPTDVKNFLNLKCFVDCHTLHRYTLLG